MQQVIHRARDRGYFDYGWLKTYHSFSFGSWYDPGRTSFGKLRVLNDDSVAPGQGFGSHPHENMEIVSIPLQGALAHKDSAGHEEVIGPNEIQVMSAGTGIMHSEYNHSSTDAVNFLQIWILPNKAGHEPRYDQKTFAPGDRKNRVQTVIAPKDKHAPLWLNQEAYFSLSSFDSEKSFNYDLRDDRNGLYLFMIAGEIEISNEKLAQRDAIGIWEVERLAIKTIRPSEILFIEVPMGP